MNLLFLFYFIFLRERSALSPGLECSGVIIAYSNFELLGSRDPPASAYRVAETTGICCHAGLICFVLFVCLFLRRGFTMLVRLVLNVWPQAVLLPRPPKMLGLQGWTKVLELAQTNFWSWSKESNLWPPNPLQYPTVKWPNLGLAHSKCTLNACWLSAGSPACPGWR